MYGPLSLKIKKTIERKKRNMSFDIQILVNGHKCKQYQYCGRTYVEAKSDSEYVIEIKNNHWKRVLAVCSVDGLNVLTGKAASDMDTGYVIGAYSSEKIKGFRFSDTEWALFKFGYKLDGKTYAQSKKNGSEKNCGIIGIRLFYEKEPIVVNITTTIINTVPVYPPVYPWPYYTWWPYYPTYYWGGGLSSGGTGLSAGGNVNNCNVNYCCSNNIDSVNLTNNTSNADTPVSVYNCSDNNVLQQQSQNSYEQSKEAFDMGTEFGRRETSKVYNVSFERGDFAQAFDIYYASRESLINMGVPLTNKLATNLPQSFSGGYCVPPKDWNG